MTAEAQVDRVQPNTASAKPQAPERPHVWVKSLTFSDGKKLELGRDEIVVVVGPNNAGKSAALKEAHHRLIQGHHNKARVLQGASFDFSGTPEEAESWVASTYSTDKAGNYRMPMVGALSPGSARTTWSRKEKSGVQALGNSMAVLLDTEARLTISNATDLINFVTEVPTHPLHRLYDDDDLETKLDGLFSRAFRQNLVVNRGAGRQVMLHIGARPNPPVGKDRQSNEYRAAVNEMPAVHEQGDGIRAFAGVLASVLAADRDVIFIDEPEAFLHPPQANLLGKILAEETPKERQLLVATHSTDFLRGVLDHSSPRVRVVRLHRIESVNRVTELKPELVRKVWADPLLRYSKVLDGLFHDGVIVCEGDADCRFYGALLDAVSRGNPGADIAFVYGAGKSRIAMIVNALRAIGVPVRVVVDFDGLAEETSLQAIVEALGGDWAAFAQPWKTVKSAVDNRRAEIPLADAKRDILSTLDREKRPTLSEASITQIREILRRGSAWSEAKRLGKAFVPSGEPLVTYEKLAAEFRKVGLFLVEVGELEGFCRTVGGHGPAWTIEVLERDLINDPELETARNFVRQLGREWPSSTVSECK